MTTPTVAMCIRWIAYILYIVSSVFLILRVRNCLHVCAEKNDLAIQIAQCFFGLTVPISIYHTWEHLSFFVRPLLQSQIVRILWMVPVFSLESLLSTIFVQYAFYFQAVREIYEAYVIYCFMRYLLHFLGDERYLMRKLATLPASMGYHKPPFCCLPAWSMGQEFLRKCKAGVFQFVVVRFLLTIASVVFYWIGLYEDGNYSFKNLYIYSIFINSVSQTWALYSLFLFYNCSHKELVTIRPFWKFLSIKLVIFFSWWQALAVSALIKLGHINSSHDHSAHQIAMLVEDLLICIEMFIAAIAFYIAFPVSDFSSFSHRNEVRASRRRTHKMKQYEKLRGNASDSTLEDGENEVGYTRRSPRIDTGSGTLKNKLHKDVDSGSAHLSGRLHEDSIGASTPESPDVLYTDADDGVGHNDSYDTEYDEFRRLDSSGDYEDCQRSLIPTRGTALSTSSNGHEYTDENKSKVGLNKGPSSALSWLSFYSSAPVVDVIDEQQKGLLESGPDSGRQTEVEMSEVDVEAQSPLRRPNTKHHQGSPSHDSTVPTVSRLSPNALNISRSPVLESNKGTKQIVRARVHGPTAGVTATNTTTTSTTSKEPNEGTISTNNNLHHRATQSTINKANGSARQPPSVFHAFLTSSVPVELQEDLNDLGSQVVDGLIVQPYQYARRIIKGSSGHS